MTNRTLVCIVGFAALLFNPARELPGATATDWLQWGGPTRNFMSDAKGLATTWPSGGPKKFWSRTLGEGHSAILADNGRLCTMYRPMTSLLRRGLEEIVVALDAATARPSGR
jgi:hypothetical protein